MSSRLGTRSARGRPAGRTAGTTAVAGTHGDEYLAGWDAVRAEERVKAGMQTWVDALDDVSR